VKEFISEIDMSVKYSLEIQDLKISYMIDGHAHGITTIVSDVPRFLN
jgi:hypothetical protein